MNYPLTQNRYKVLLLTGLTLILLILSDPSMAASTSGGGLPFDSWFDSIINSITGPYAYAVSVIGIVAAGSALIFGGDMNGFMRVLIFIVLVLSFIVAAKNSLSAITGQGAEITVNRDVAIGESA